MVTAGNMDFNRYYWGNPIDFLRIAFFRGATYRLASEE